MHVDNLDTAPSKVNLQTSTMVDGAMLHGMFEDRIQNVIREVKERPNVFLFEGEVHTRVGCSALDAPSDAATSSSRCATKYKEYIPEDESLALRFQSAIVREPMFKETRAILYNMRVRLARRLTQCR